jgi:hypothetical protein
MTTRARPSYTITVFGPLWDAYRAHGRMPPSALLEKAMVGELAAGGHEVPAVPPVSEQTMAATAARVRGRADAARAVAKKRRGRKKSSA